MISIGDLFLGGVHAAGIRTAGLFAAVATVFAGVVDWRPTGSGGSSP
ncbi:hypothetical protein GJR88_00003 [Dietzia sp. DQ12-45-1b]|nr:hypothetical protein GJR88_00003 [Dietzia sp. DQ12-45-1b]